MILRYGWIASWDISCHGGFCLESGSLSLTYNITTLLDTLLTIDT